MQNLVIHPHNRIQEWVAREMSYFAEEGLQCEFTDSSNRPGGLGTATPPRPTESEAGASGYEAFVRNCRKCNIISTSHWAVDIAASAGHGRVWGQAYSVMPAGVYVHPRSAIREPEALAGVEIVVGKYSGRQFSAMHRLESVIAPSEIKLKFVDGSSRIRLLLEGEAQAGSLIGPEAYVFEQQGFQKVLDTSFIVNFLIAGNPPKDDVEKYFNALRRAQKDIDAAPDRYKHYLLEEFPDQLRPLLDVRKCGIGERLVFEPYSRAMFEQAIRWGAAQSVVPNEWFGTLGYDQAVM